VIDRGGMLILVNVGVQVSKYEALPQGDGYCQQWLHLNLRVVGIPQKNVAWHNTVVITTGEPIVV